MFWSFASLKLDKVKKKNIHLYTHQLCGSYNEIKLLISNISLDIIWIIQQLNIRGYYGYLYGSCIRKLIFGKLVNKIKIVTNAQSDFIQYLCKDVFMLKKNVYFFYINSCILVKILFFDKYKISCKCNKNYNSVIFLMKDVVEEKIFTINGLFFNPINNTLYDLVGAKCDLDKKIIRTIKDPNIIFKKYPILIFKYISIVSKLNYLLDITILRIVRFNMHYLRYCSSIKIQNEIISIIISGYIKLIFFILCHTCGASFFLLSNIFDFHVYNYALIEKKYLFINKEIYLSYKETMKIILSILDKIILKGCYISSSVILSSMIFVYLDVIKKGMNNNRHIIDNFCEILSKKINISKREQYKISLLLNVVTVMSQKSINIYLAKKIINKDWFVEALLLYMIYILFNKKSLYLVYKWQVLANYLQKHYKQNKCRSKIYI